MLSGRVILMSKYNKPPYNTSLNLIRGDSKFRAACITILDYDLVPCEINMK